MTYIRALLFSVLIHYTLCATTDRIIFHHIPKTAGTTIRTILRKQVSSKEIFPPYFQYQIEDTPLLELSQHKLIWGHFLFSRFKGISGKRITFLRDPVERVLSAHRYYKQRADQKRRMSKDHICPPGDPVKVLRNNQCKYLSSLDIYNPAFSDKQHLESAKYNLQNNFFFVGITEDIDNAYRILCKLLGSTPPDSVPRRNVTKKQRESYPESLIHEIKKRNSEDIKLYQFAKKLYEKKYKHSTCAS